MRIGTPLSATATRALLLGSGELGKEVAIELQRLGVETIAADRYPNAPAMQVAHRAQVLDMRDRESLRRVVETERPHLVIPEIEAIATDELLALEAQGWRPQAALPLSPSHGFGMSGARWRREVRIFQEIRTRHQEVLLHDIGRFSYIQALSSLKHLSAKPVPDGAGIDKARPPAVKDYATFAIGAG